MNFPFRDSSCWNVPSGNEARNFNSKFVLREIFLSNFIMRYIRPLFLLRFFRRNVRLFFLMDVTNSGCSQDRLYSNDALERQVNNEVTADNYVPFLLNERAIHWSLSFQLNCKYLCIFGKFKIPEIKIERLLSYSIDKTTFYLIFLILELSERLK